MKHLDRRRVLRGALAGGAVSVGLPLLDCFLNGNGNALADGKPIPVRFGTWAWACGMNKNMFVPKKLGRDFDLPPEIEALGPLREKINLFTNFNTFRDGAPLLCHTTGWVILRSGHAPLGMGDQPGETIDVTVAKKIGTTTRFPAITATATGDRRVTQSYENANSTNASEPSPLALYATIFGPEFQDPNAEVFHPSPRVMARKSVLSGVMDDVKKLHTLVGAEDKARLDQYFTGLRGLERQFELQLTKPEPRPACTPAKGLAKDPPVSMDAARVAERHALLTDLIAMAVACDQTRVFNMTYARGTASTTRPGYDKPHHVATHEEATDAQLGYQPNVSWFTCRAMESLAYFIEAFAKMKEGDGALLDNVLIYATTETAYARIHSVEGLPMFTAGRAGGRIKSGFHIDGGGSPNTRLGYTALRALGLDVESWGHQSNNTSKEIGEILV